MLDHPNRDRQFIRGGIHDASPNEKSHRKDIPQDVIDLARKMRRLINLFSLSEVQVNQIIKDHFGEGVGYQTTRIFLNQTYGPGFRCREKTLTKYRYLVKYLIRLKKQFAKPTKCGRLSNVQVDKLNKNKPTK